MNYPFRIPVGAQTDDVIEMLQSARQIKVAEEEALNKATPLLDNLYAALESGKYHSSLTPEVFKRYAPVIGPYLNSHPSCLPLPEGDFKLNRLFYPDVHWSSDENRERRQRTDIFHVDYTNTNKPVPKVLWHVQFGHPTTRINNDPSSDYRDEIYTGFLQLNCALDPWVAMIFELYPLSSSLKDYRLDIENTNDQFFCYQRLWDKFADVSLFERLTDEISRFTGTDVNVSHCTNSNSRVLISKRQTMVQVSMPNSFDFEPDKMILQGDTYLGKDFFSAEDSWQPLNKAGSWLIAGQNGSGKSNFTHCLIQNLLAQKKGVEALKLVDLKEGVEWFPYAKHEKVTVISEYEDVHAMAEETLATIKKRAIKMRENGTRECKDDFIFLAFDEFSSIPLHPAVGKSEKDKLAILLKTLTQIAQKGRSVNVRLIISEQRTTADMLPPAINAQMKQRVLFRVMNNQTVALMFGSSDGLPIQPQQLQPGQFMYEGGDGVIRLLQAPYVDDSQL